MATDATTDPVAARLAEIRGLTEGITAAPWESPLPYEVTHGYEHKNGRHVAAWIANTDNGDQDISDEEAQANAAFIARSRTDVPALLAALEAVLALHRPDHHKVRQCEFCQSNWPCRTYRDVRAALLGETGQSLGEQPHPAAHCNLGGRPHPGPCTDPEGGTDG
jgi:hypothetical protein